MFGIKTKTRKPEIITRVQKVTVRDPQDVALAARVADTIKRAEDEIARLHKEVTEALDARDAGKHYAQDILDRQLGEMRAVMDMIATLKGTDHIIETVQQERKAQARINEVFPFNSFIGGSSLIYPPKN